MIFLPMMTNSAHTKGEGVLMSIAIHLISDTMSSPAPKDQKTCYLYWLNSNFSPYTCDWQHAMNHFEYLWETSDDILTNDDKQRAYKRRGGIDERCYPLDLRDEMWGALVKRLASSSEGSHQASSLLLTKKINFQRNC